MAIPEGNPLAVSPEFLYRLPQRAVQDHMLEAVIHTATSFDRSYWLNLLSRQIGASCNHAILHHSPGTGPHGCVHPVPLIPTGSLLDWHPVAARD